MDRRHCHMSPNDISRYKLQLPTDVRAIFVIASITYPDATCCAGSEQSKNSPRHFLQPGPTSVYKRDYKRPIPLRRSATPIQSPDPAIASHSHHTQDHRSDPRGGHGRELPAPEPARQVPRPRLPRLAPPGRGGGRRHRRVERRRQHRLRLPPLLHLQRQLRHRRHRFHQEHRTFQCSTSLPLLPPSSAAPKRLWQLLGY
jgi:hypothetical protein